MKHLPFNIKIKKRFFIVLFSRNTIIYCIHTLPTKNILCFYQKIFFFKAHLITHHQIYDFWKVDFIFLITKSTDSNQQ